MEYKSGKQKSTAVSSLKKLVAGATVLVSTLGTMGTTAYADNACNPKKARSLSLSEVPKEVAKRVVYGVMAYKGALQGEKVGVTVLFCKDRVRAVSVSGAGNVTKEVLRSVNRNLADYKLSVVYDMPVKSDIRVVIAH